MRKLLNDEIAVRSRRNVVQGRSFAEMLERAIRAYQNRSLEAAEVTRAAGFEYHEADILNSTGFRVTVGDKLTFNYDGHHGSIAPFEYSNA